MPELVAVAVAEAEQVTVEEDQVVMVAEATAVGARVDTALPVDMAPPVDMAGNPPMVVVTAVANRGVTSKVDTEEGTREDMAAAVIKHVRLVLP